MADMDELRRGWAAKDLREAHEEIERLRASVATLVEQLAAERSGLAKQSADRIPMMADADLPQRYREELQRRKAAEARVEDLLTDREREVARLAACCMAAEGHEKHLEGMLSEYDSPALRAVRLLRSRLSEVERERDALEVNLDEKHARLVEIADKLRALRAAAQPVEPRDETKPPPACRLCSAPMTTCWGCRTCGETTVDDHRNFMRTGAAPPTPPLTPERAPLDGKVRG